MSVDVYKWIGSYPERLKKSGLRQNLSGKHQVSDKVTPQSIQDKYRDISDIAVLSVAAIMSLWQISETQQNNSTQKFVGGNNWRTKTTATTPIQPCTIRMQRGHRSIDKGFTNPSRHAAWKILKTAHLPVNISGETVNGLAEIIRDFGRVYGTKIVNITTDANTSIATVGQLLQNSRFQAQDTLGNCETVVKSINQKATNDRRNVKSVHVIVERKENCHNSVLGLLPIVSSVIQANNLCVLLTVQAQVIKVAITCVITARLFLLKSFLKQCEYLGLQGQFKVNKTVSKSDISSVSCAEKATKKNIIITASVGSVNHSAFNMADRGAVNPNEMGGAGGFGAGGMEEDENLWGGQGQDDGAGLREVPDFRHYLGDGNDDEDDVWDDNDMFQLPQEARLRLVPEALENQEAKHPIDDEFANQLIYDPEEFAAFAGGDINPAVQPLPGDDQEMQLFLNQGWPEFENEDPRADAA